jgi:hypothetical protein
MSCASDPRRQFRFCHRLSSFRDAWQVHSAGSRRCLVLQSIEALDHEMPSLAGPLVHGALPPPACSARSQSVCGWRFAPQCCAWQSVQGRCRVRQLRVPLGRQVGAVGSRRSRPYRSASPAARHPRDAQPFHREDSPRQAGSSLSCQTLGARKTQDQRSTTIAVVRLMHRVRTILKNPPLAVIATVLTYAISGCSVSRVDNRVDYWQSISQTKLLPGTPLSEAQELFKAHGLELRCCTSGPNIKNAYTAIERNVGRKLLVEYDVVVLVDVSPDQKIERVRVQRWGVGL